MSQPTIHGITRELARAIACQHYYGPATANRGCCSAACKNCKYGSPDYLCEICKLEQAIADALQPIEDQLAALVKEMRSYNPRPTTFRTAAISETQHKCADAIERILGAKE